METKTLKSGHELKLALADFTPANKLRKLVARELLSVGVDFDKLPKLKQGQTFMDLDVDAKLVNTIKNTVLTLLASDAIEAQVMQCAGRCTIDGKKITMQLFEADLDFRGDLLEVQYEILWANLSVFFGSLGSLFSRNSEAVTSDQSPA